ncbi:MAG: hypothetical protein IJW92_07285, partial [Clostridia bacterium]|nr:hypothetical protein [Clostridia bacterium]
MALKKRESVLWGAAKFAADALRAGAVNGIFHPLFSFYDRLELQFQSGWFGLVGEHGYKRTGWQYRLRQAGMRSSEKSVFLHLFRKLLRFALQSSLASYGLLMLFTGAAFAVESILVKRFSTSVWNLAASVVLVLSSFPLLISEQSLSAALRKSRLSRAFFCDFCGIVQDRFGNFEVGKERPRFVLLLSGALSLAAYLFSPLRVCVAVALLICLWVLFAVPECTLLLIFFAFPFLGLLEHSTMVLCMLVLLADVTWFCKTVCGRRDFSFELLDLLVGLFAVLLLLGGFVGGSVWQGVSLFCLVTVYFPARNLLLQPVWRRRAVRA